MILIPPEDGTEKIVAKLKEKEWKGKCHVQAMSQILRVLDPLKFEKQGL